MIEPAARYLHIGASLVLFGALLFGRYACGGDARRTQLVRGAAFVGLLAALASAALKSQALGAPPQILLATQFGRVAAAQIALLAACGCIPRPAGWIALTLSGAQLALFALIGHAYATSGVGGGAWEAAHLLATSTWIGGLAALGLALQQNPSPSMVRRFSRVGYIAVSLIAVSGFALLQTNTTTLAPSTTTPYGRLALLKLAAFAAALTLAAFNRFVTAPRQAWRPLTHVIVAELALMALLVGLGLTLAATMPRA